MSLPIHQGEVKALVALLEQDWETPEQLAEALAVALDEARGTRTTYVAVLQFGPYSEASQTVFYHGLGPYPGFKSARNAALKFPGSSVASKIVVVPLTNEEWLEQKLREVG